MTWLSDLEGAARAALPAPVFEYLAQGARDSVSTLEAPWGWTERRFLPHVLRDVTEVDLSVPLLGTPARVPWGDRADHAAAGGPPRR